MKIPNVASKAIKISAIVLAVLALYGVLGFKVLPAVLTAQLPDIIHDKTGRKATLAKIAFNPFNLRCRLQDFKMLEKNGQPFVAFDSFATKINLWQSIKLRALAIEEVTLRKPFVHIARLKNDDFNFADMAKGKPDKDKKSGKIFPVNISKIAIVDGKLNWEDNHSDKSVQEKISPINLKIDNFTTNADQQSKLGITLALMSGGKLDWKGKIGVNPITSQGQIKLDKIKLSTLLGLASPTKPDFDLQGYEKLSADYKLDYIKDSLKLSLSKSKLELVDFKLAKKQPAPLQVSIPNLSLGFDCQLTQAKKNLKLKADKTQLAIQDFQLDLKGEKPLLLKTLDIKHEAAITLTVADKLLQLTADKDKLDVRELVFDQQGATSNLVKIPVLTHKANIKLSKTDKSLDVSTDKAVLDIRDLVFKQGGDVDKTIEIPVITHEIDILLKKTQQDLQITANKAKLNIGQLLFKEQGDQKRSISIPTASHEADIQFIQNDKGMQVISKKARLDVGNLDFKDSGQNKMALKIPMFSHETNLQFSLADKTWQVSTDKTQISSKNIQLSGMDIAPILLKIPEIGLETAYKTDNKGDNINFVTSKGKFDLQKMQLDDTEHKTTLAKMAAFGFSGLGVNLKDKSVQLDSVTASHADMKAWLNADKTINYQTLFSVKPVHAAHHRSKPVAVSGKKATDQPWQVKVNQLAFNDFGLDFEDRTLKKTAAMSARPINLQLKHFSTRHGTSLPLQLSVGVNKSGLIKITGNAVLEPFSTHLAVSVDKLALNKFQPYVDKFARLDIIDGDLNVDGKLAVVKKTNDMDVKFKGNTHIASLVTRDQILNKDFVKWDKLSLNSIDADVLSNRYSAESLVMDKPYARVSIRKDKSINVNDIMIAEHKHSTAASKTTSKKSSAPSGKKLFFRLNKVKIIDGASDFSDLSLILPFAAPIKGLNGGASGLSSEQNSKITLALEGNAFELSPVKIKGALSPYLGDFDVDMHFDGMPMPLVSPYMVQFAGYKVEKGKLTLGLKYTVEKKQLTASNSVLIDQLELGEKVENPNAVSLPLELAITLLKDSSGKIKIDVPVTGSLEDPKFNIGSIIGDALLNVLTKIIASPFNAIAGLVGSDEDLSTVSFAPGTEALTPEQMGKLDDVAKALKERPALNLEIKGAAFKEQDWPILREDALHDQLKRVKAKEDNKENDKKILSEYVYLSADDYNRLLRDVFFQQYPNLAKKSLFGTPTLINDEKADFYAFAKKKLAETLEPDPKRLKDLAAERAQAIAKYLAQKAGVPNDRIFILDTVVDPERDDKAITSRLSLKTN